MATATTMRPLVSLALPDRGAARLATQLFLALAGTLLLTLSAKTKVVLGPVDISLQTLAVLLIASAFGMRLAVATLVLYLAEGAMGLRIDHRGAKIPSIAGSPSVATRPRATRSSRWASTDRLAAACRRGSVSR